MTKEEWTKVFEEKNQRKPTMAEFLTAKNRNFEEEVKASQEVTAPIETAKADQSQPPLTAQEKWSQNFETEYHRKPTVEEFLEAKTRNFSTQKDKVNLQPSPEPVREASYQPANVPPTVIHNDKKMQGLLIVSAVMSFAYFLICITQVYSPLSYYVPQVPMQAMSFIYYSPFAVFGILLLMQLNREKIDLRGSGILFILIGTLNVLPYLINVSYYISYSALSLFISLSTLCAGIFIFAYCSSQAKSKALAVLASVFSAFPLLYQLYIYRGYFPFGTLNFYLPLLQFGMILFLMLYGMTQSARSWQSTSSRPIRWWWVLAPVAAVFVLVGGVSYYLNATNMDGQYYYIYEYSSSSYYVSDTPIIISGNDLSFSSSGSTIDYTINKSNSTISLNSSSSTYSTDYTYYDGILKLSSGSGEYVKSNSSIYQTAINNKATGSNYSSGFGYLSENNNYTDSSSTDYSSSYSSSSSSSEENGLVTSGGMTYFYQNGVKETGYQTSGGATYYFDPSTGAEVQEMRPMTGTYWQQPTSTGTQPDLAQYSNLSVNVVLSEQRAYIKSGNKVIYVMYISSGVDNATPTGNFQIEAEKGATFYNASEGEGGNYWISFKDHGVYLFHSSVIDSSGNYIPSEGELIGKQPASHGCIRLTVSDAQWFQASIPVGTPVNIQ